MMSQERVMFKKQVDPTIRYGRALSDYARSFRQIALEIHDDPCCITHYMDLPAIDFLVNDVSSTTLERTKYLEALSYGDPGVLLACPGPSLSGIAMRELGSPEQIRHFYQLLKEKKMRTCFALTEPEKGSDATRIKTRIIKKNNRVYLNGKKCFFGNGAVAETGIVFAKIADNPVGTRAILLTSDILNSAMIEKETLPQFSLRGAQIAAMRFNHVEIPNENILGSHLSFCHNGSLAIIKIFNQFRTGVGALAVGQAQGVFDICLQKYAFYFTQSELHSIDSSLSNARELLHQSAIKIDCNAMDGLSASVAKVNATHTAEQVIQHCYDRLPFDSLLSEPWLVKSLGDVFAWEYMEGTTHIHRNHISRQLDSIVKNI